MAKIEMLWDHLDDIRWKDQWVEWMKPAHVQQLLFQFLGEGGEYVRRTLLMLLNSEYLHDSRLRSPNLSEDTYMPASAKAVKM